MPAPIVFDDEGEFGDGSRYELLVRAVEASNEFPEGVRYSFQYMDADGTTLLRYDNYTAEHGARHHRHHYRDGISPVEFERWEDHVRTFVCEMREMYDERN